MKEIKETVQWKAILSTKRLSDILEIAAEGYINVIGTNLPTQWAKANLVLGIDVSLGVVKSKVVGSRDDDGRATKRQRTTENAKEEEEEESSDAPKLDPNGCMDLSDRSYARDPRPLLEGCNCMACRQGQGYSRAYIHHLIFAKELLATILIFAHNLHHLLRLIQAFNDASCPAVVKEHIEQQLPLYELQK